MPRYVTRGPVRGTCSHHHRTLSGAARCGVVDRAGCRRQGGYSDRRVAGAQVDLSASEEAELFALTRGEQGAPLDAEVQP